MNKEKIEYFDFLKGIARIWRQMIGFDVTSFLAIIRMLFSFDLDYRSNSIEWKTTTYLDNISFGVYLLYPYFLSFVIRALINRIPIGGYFTNQVILTTMILIYCMITISIIRRISKKYSIKHLEV
ncbi:MAG: hypothetical protein M0P77_06775 [Firmicutes bacterium]|nr:hypothetical protein [Bacillota bacterium]